MTMDKVRVVSDFIQITVCSVSQLKYIIQIARVHFRDTSNKMFKVQQIAAFLVSFH